MTLQSQNSRQSVENKNGQDAAQQKSDWEKNNQAHVRFTVQGKEVCMTVSTYASYVHDMHFNTDEDEKTVQARYVPGL